MTSWFLDSKPVNLDENAERLGGDSALAPSRSAGFVVPAAYKDRVPMAPAVVGLVDHRLHP